MEELTKLTAQAAETILRFGRQGRDVRTKADGSPVTAADEAAEAVICDGPAAACARTADHLGGTSGAAKAGRPIVRGSYFLVDPLDGTREFIAGRDEYTINIALMSGGAPVLGDYLRAGLRLTWRGIVGRGADRIAVRTAAAPAQIHTRPRPAREVVIVVSRSHLDARTRAYVDGFPQAKLVQCGSSIKFCRVAEGAADLYPRLAPTRDWDIAAGHAILTSGRRRRNRAGWLAAALSRARIF